MGSVGGAVRPPPPTPPPCVDAAWADLSIPSGAPAAASGTSAVVYRARWCPPPQPSLPASGGDGGGGGGGGVSAAITPIDVAVRRPRITSAEALERFGSEVALRAALPPTRILFDALHVERRRPPPATVLSLLSHIGSGVEHLHRAGLVHRDLKTANVLLADAGRSVAVVADLDLLAPAGAVRVGRASGRGPSAGRLSHMVGTLAYMPPEVLTGAAAHGPPGDVYAWGVVANETAAAAVPYVDARMDVAALHTVLETRFNEVALRGAIVRDGLRPRLAVGMPAPLGALITAAWAADAAARPTMATVMAVLGSLGGGGGAGAPGPAWALPSLAEGESHWGDADDAGARKLAALRLADGSAAAAPPEEVASVAAATAWTTAWAAREGSSANPPWFIGTPPEDTPGGSPPAADAYTPTLTAGVAATPGDRGADRMEDRHVLLTPAVDRPYLLAAVLDGHGGDGCADYVATRLDAAVATGGGVVRAAGGAGTDAPPGARLGAALAALDARFRATHPADPSGATVVAALLTPPASLAVANVGDSRAVLYRSVAAAAAAGVPAVVPLSRDHVATDAAEAAAVAARGGTVTAGRVNGVLAVSRALGDAGVKPAAAADAEVVTTRLGPADEFLVLASDGLWDVVGVAEVARLVRTTVRVAGMAARRLAALAVDRGCGDNVTVVVVYLTPVSTCMTLEE
ncbi:hypothetical protein MMPV_003636 [Pyropia vietnamensis]